MSQRTVSISMSTLSLIILSILVSIGHGNVQELVFHRQSDAFHPIQRSKYNPRFFLPKVDTDCETPSKSTPPFHASLIYSRIASSFAFRQMKFRDATKSRKSASWAEVHQTNSLRLRGGGLLEYFSGVCSCFNFCGSEPPTNEPAGDKTKRRVGRMAGNVDINANIRKIYCVISDVEHYGDWGGNGLQSIKILESGHSHSVAEYVCGSFGFTFHFTVFWAFSPPGDEFFNFQSRRLFLVCFHTGKVTFRNVEPAGLIHSLKGEYTLSEKGPKLTNVHFVVVADTRGDCFL